MSIPRDPDRLLMACQKGNVALVRQLVEKEGIDPNHANGIRQSALHVAAWWSRYDCLEYLLQQGANVHATNTMTGATPLHCTFQSSKAALDPQARLQSIRVLLQHGADPQAMDPSQRTPLDYLDNDDPDREQIIALFQEWKEPQPTLFIAIANRDLDTFTTCLQESTTTATTTTPCWNSIYQKNTPLLQLIRDWCGNDDDDDDDQEPIDDPFYKTAILKLVEVGGIATLTVTTANQERPLDLLCHAIVQRYKQCSNQLDPLGKEWCDTVTALVQRNHGGGAGDSSSTSSQSSTTTSNSSSNNNNNGPIDHSLLFSESTQSLWMEIARRNLLELAVYFQQSWNISSKVMNRQGMTPLQFAARSGHVEMLPWVCHPEILHHQDYRGQTALDAATINGHDHVVQWLQDYALQLPQ